MTCRHFFVSGRVQGVFFRSSAQREAASLGLRGWVRNRHDGRVEGVACGDEQALETFVKWLQIGPDSAKVTTIEVTTIEPPEELHGFSVRPTGS